MRVTIVAAATGGPVLAVPIGSVASRTDGATVVTVLDGQATRDVVVTTGVQADGLVQVTPTDGGLSAGDTVLMAGSATPS